MAGFLINGCGAADSYYKLKGVGEAYCPRCRKQKPWELAMLKMKIRVVFIPTVSVSTKYAVMCSGCRQGYYVSEEQKKFILDNPPSCVEVQLDGVVIHGMGQDMSQAAEEPQTQQNPQPPRQPQPEPSGGRPSSGFAQPEPSRAQPSPRPVQPAPRIAPAPPASVQESQAFKQQAPRASSSGFEERGMVCPGCRRQVRPGVRFCGFCGAALPAQGVQGQQKIRHKDNGGQLIRHEDNSAQLISRLGRRKICLRCQMVFPADKETCNICGSKLADKP